MSPRIKLKGGGYMSHKMASGSDDKGNNYAFPTVMPDASGRLVEMSPHDAWKQAMRTGDYKNFGKDAGAAQGYAEGDYKKGTVADSFENRQRMLAQIMRGERYR